MPCGADAHGVYFSACGKMGCGASRHGEGALDVVATVSGPNGPRDRPFGHAGGNAGAADKKSHPNREDQAQTLLLQGNATFLQQNYADAVKLFNRALALNPNLVRAYYERGLAYQAMQMWDDAVRDMDRVLKRQPDNIAALTVKAECRLRRGDWEGALVILNEGIRTHPGESRLFSLRAECHRAAGHLEAAEEDRAAEEEAEGHKTCVVCMEEERGARLHPCMHACMCRDCAEQLLECCCPCPICGVRIESVEAGTFTSTFAFERNGRGQSRTPRPRTRPGVHPVGTPASTPRASGGDAVPPSPPADRPRTADADPVPRDLFSLTPGRRGQPRRTWDPELAAIAQEPSVGDVASLTPPSVAGSPVRPTQAPPAESPAAAEPPVGVDASPASEATLGREGGELREGEASTQNLDYGRDQLAGLRAMSAAGAGAAGPQSRRGVRAEAAAPGSTPESLALGAATPASASTPRVRAWSEAREPDWPGEGHSEATSPSDASPASDQTGEQSPGIASPGAGTSAGSPTVACDSLGQGRGTRELSPEEVDSWKCKRGEVDGGAEGGEWAELGMSEVADVESVLEGVVQYADAAYGADECVTLHEVAAVLGQ